MPKESNRSEESAAPRSPVRFMFMSPVTCHLSLCRYAKYLQYPLQLLVAEKGDFHRPLALRIAELDLGAEFFAQPVLQVRHVRIGAWRGDRFRLNHELARITGLQFGHQTLGLPDVQALLDDAFGGELLFFIVGKTENDLGVANRKPPFADKILNDLRQFQQAQRIGHHRAAFAEFERDFLLRELKLTGQLFVTMRFLDGVEIFAL